ncbi:UDP-N-acetylglucosamine 1-carboxyvinyltransferase [Cryptosporangium aurantiacum]|uniref:UDP-N-acetylglucosamine 1-carboxyvinyltransferase n=1 Tax=Cryptosporangium aurantiacum TaxID=134849 RepID=UPI00093283E7|nr:UDP-N-acetylglucosamine 1-carboxyvinyltransferase [Cryptosporangium aurantiacum]
MELFRVTGGTPLIGEVTVSGAKNSVLKLMAASLLVEGRTVLTNVPRILDVTIMSEVLRRLGCEAALEGETLTIDVPAQPGTEADYNLVRRMRASINVLGPLLARRGEVRVPHPGGDAIGSRGLDYHIAGLERMGAEITSEHGFVVARASRLHGARIWLDFPSVGATENILMAAVLAKGTTVIDNAAREPDIVDICSMLTEMGAEISGAGTSTLEVEGVEELRPVTHRVVPDRIVSGTWAFAAAITQGDITVRHGEPRHLEIALDKLNQAGAQIDLLDPMEPSDGFRVRMDRRPRAVDIVTLPYPGFATDMLPMAITLGAVADGPSMVTENVFDARFMFINEMLRLGADVRTDGHHAVVRGKDWLSGAPVRATDIRAGVGLVIAGLRADGVTEVADAFHIDRGYPDFLAQMRGLGATIDRVTVEDDEFDGVAL